VEKIEATVILPVYNEADYIESCVHRVKAALERFSYSYEVIIAEDGSKDKTDEIAARLAVEDERITHLHSPKRLGRGAALKRAIKHALGEVIVYMDTDLATSIDHLPALIELTKKSHGISTGSRLIKGALVKRPALRRVVSKGYNLFVCVLFRDKIHDHQCGFKAFSRTMLTDILDQVNDDGWFFDTEIIVRATKAGYQAIEIPVRWVETRNKRESKVKVFHDGKQMGLALLRFWWKTKMGTRF